MEEIKTLPSRIAERLGEDGESTRRRRIRRFHPMMLEELMHMPGEPGDPVGILMAASLVRDDIPWLYELAMEVYRAVKNGNAESIDRELHRLRRFSDVLMHGPFMEDLAFGRKEYYMIAMEFPRMLEHTLRRTLALHRSVARKREKPVTDDGAHTEQHRLPRP
jgi:hypothetical protein